MLLSACRAVLGRARQARGGRLILRASASASHEPPTPPPGPPPLSWPRRDCLAGSLREADCGRTVTLCGWVDRQRNLGGLVFADVRDHSGLVQVVGPPDGSPARATLEAVRAEYCVCVTGTVRLRESPNARLPTGAVELLAHSVTLLSAVTRPLPFLVSGGGDAAPASEETRLRARVLELRRPALSSALRLRHCVVRALRAVLEERHGFTEVETPILTRSTPEGARDFLVPSRTRAGAAFALPQSPQLFKQLLMMGGMDRYYQLARCFRDEDLRSDRQPEFTQLDVEMAFSPAEDIMALGEELMAAAWLAGAGAQLPRPFPRMTYAHAMARYGCDKPDTRYGILIHDLTELVRRHHRAAAARARTRR
jgi:aspartyl-tRNA synthetase